MKSNNSLLVAPLLGLIFQCGQPADKRNKVGDTAVVDHTVVDTSKIAGRTKLENEIQTAMFIEKVALGGMLEDTLGKLAFKKANNQGVRIFGKLMEQDHKRMNDDLEALSIAKGLKLPVSLPANDLEQVRQMSKMETDYFEKLYIKMMIEDHNKNIELFRGADNSPDTAVRNFARKFLPVLETHRRKALEVRERIQ